MNVLFLFEMEIDELYDFFFLHVTHLNTFFFHFSIII